MTTQSQRCFRYSIHRYVERKSERITEMFQVLLLSDWSQTDATVRRGAASRVVVEKQDAGSNNRHSPPKMTILLICCLRSKWKHTASSWLTRAGHKSYGRTQTRSSEYSDWRFLMRYLDVLKAQWIWLWSLVPRETEPRITELAKASSNLPNSTDCPSVRMVLHQEEG